MSFGVQVQTRIAEDIALLHSLGDHPSLPVSPVPCTRDMQHGHIMSLDIERELASDLAFLSSIRDDVECITAVAVHEIAGNRLRILVAANATQKGPPSPYLAEVKSCFDGIISLMKTANSNRREQCESDILDAIVRMCKQRIRQRTRLGTAKPPLTKHLAEAIGILTSKTRNGPQEVFLAQATRLLLDLNNLSSTKHYAGRENEEVTASTRRLIASCAHTEQATDTKTFLIRDVAKNLPKFNPKEAWSIWNMIRKIGRYQTCAARLARLARSDALFRQIDTVCVFLDETSLQCTVQTTRATEDEVGTRVGAVGGLSKPQVSKLLGISAGSTKTGRSFRDSLSKAQGTSAKIHAEIQLVWYIKQQAVRDWPRVIESNKMACFLCGAFIAWTGDFAVPRSHGKIYPGWRLPSMNLDKVHKKFAKNLENYVVNCLKEPVNSSKVLQGLIADCESSATLQRVTIESVMTTISGIGDESQEIEVEVQTDDGSEETVREDGITTPRASLQTYISTGPRQDEIETVEPLKAEQYVAKSLPLEVIWETPRSAPWTSIRPGDTICTRPCPRLQVLVEHEDRQCAGQKELSVRVRRLSAIEAEDRCAKERIHDIDKDLELGKEIACGKGCDSVLMRLGAEVYIAEVETQTPQR